MPHIILKGVVEADVKAVSLELTAPLAKMIGCPEDHITIEYLPVVFYTEGVAGQGGYPFVNIQWFKRPTEIRQRVASLFHDFFTGRGYAENVVIFTDLIPDYYFENGKHF